MPFIVQSNTHQAPGRYWLKLLVLGLVYFVVARASLFLAIPGSNASPVWPPSGLALAILLIGGLRLWPAILGGAFAANLMGFASHGLLTPTLYAAALSIGLGNSLEALIAAYLLRKLAGPDLLWQRLKEAIGFACIAPLACLVSASIGVASLLASGKIPAHIANTVWQTWWLGDLCGMVVLAPFLVIWCTAGLRHGTQYRLPTRLGYEVWGAILGVLLVAGLIFSTPFESVAQSRPFLVLLVPILVVTAWRYGLRGATAAMVAIVVAAVAATLRGHGLLEAGPLHQVLLQLNILLILLAIINLLLAADRTELHATQQTHKPVRSYWKTQLLPWGTLSLGCVLSIVVWHFVAQGSEVQSRLRFENQVDNIFQSLDAQIKNYQRVLISAAGLFTDRNAVARSTWHDYVAAQNLRLTLPGIQGLGYAEWIAPTDVPKVTQRVRTEGFPDFTVRPAGVRDEYTSIILLEPFDTRNQRAFGFDMWSEPTRRAAMTLARDSGQIAATGKVRLLQENGEDEQAGFLMYQPVYRAGTKPLNRPQRQQQLLGFVYAPFRASDFMRAAVSNLLEGVWLDVFDITSAPPGQESTRLFPAPRNAINANGPQIGRLSTIRTLSVGQHQWEIRISSLDQFWISIDHTRSRVVLIAGIVLSAFLFLLIRTLTKTQQQAQQLADQMTQAYQETHSSLDSLVRSARAAVIIANQEGTIEHWNPAAIHLFGALSTTAHSLTLSQLVTTKHAAALEEVLNAWRKGEMPRHPNMTIEGLHQEGRTTLLQLSLSSWGIDTKRKFGAIFNDLSEQQRADEFERGLFEEAQEAMLISAADGRIVRANARAAQVLGFSCAVLQTMRIEDFVPPSLRDRHVEHRAGYGKNASRRAMGSTLELSAMHADGHAFPVEISLNTLRLNNITHYVTTVVDISARKAIKKQLQDTLAFQESILRNAGLSIIATDLSGLILSFNSAAERMLGYRAEEMIGKQTPAIIHDLSEVAARAEALSAELGYPVAAGFEAFVARARLGQLDEREWTYIRKDGSRFPVRLSVTGLFDSTGALNGFLGIAADISDSLKHKEEMQHALQEKETLLREVYHRVKNNLQVVSSLFNLQIRNLPAGPAREVLFEGAQRVRSMALVHEKLYQSNTLSSIKLNEYVQDLCRQLFDVNGAEARGIYLDTALDDVPVGLDQAVPLGLLINELLTNSLKHAFGEQGGKITVRAQKVEDKLVLEIADNGKGFDDPAHSENEKSLGLRLARTLTRQLDGTLQYENRHGAYAQICFPFVPVAPIGKAS